MCYENRLKFLLRVLNYGGLIRDVCGMNMEGGGEVEDVRIF